MTNLRRGLTTNGPQSKTIYVLTTFWMTCLVFVFARPNLKTGKDQHKRSDIWLLCTASAEPSVTSLFACTVHPQGIPCLSLVKSRANI
ncbi:hypothetical protein BDV39DRAFT_167241 [Aspergillus sergii]|uniref:Uncharacterized protein n=1 Tax=Aspergillus sergii TaxID=1034303 RepID=A0A5N6XH76_9EURO|nr:hypothetical protein BDV39DRAFT_167241 [Aspergillus sergii]